MKAKDRILRIVPAAVMLWLLIRFPREMTEGVRRGLTLCGTAVIPSLFPFLTLCTFFVRSGLCALDIGASTGGFTECLLRRGARMVYALDVGRDQLDEKIKNDARVISMEGRNARYMHKSDFPQEPELITMDVSFIPQELIYPACAALLAPGRKMITLVKPQFEAGKENVGKGGIVKDRDGSVLKAILARVDAAAEAAGFRRDGLIKSPIEGGDGNTEYLAVFTKVREG